MADEFLMDADPAVESAETTGVRGDREPVRVILMGSRHGIVSIIYRLHSLGFAQVTEWSKPQPAPEGKLMCVCTKYVGKDEGGRMREEG